VAYSRKARSRWPRLPWNNGLNLHRSRLWATFLLTTVILSACAGRTRVYHGILLQGFEKLEFRPCKTSEGTRGERWLPVFADGASEELLTLNRGAHASDSIKVAVRGRLGAKAPTGHLGQLDRVITVAQFMPWSAPTDIDCTQHVRRM